MKIPSGQLEHIGIVVKNLLDSAKKMARMYGIARWDVVHHGAERLSSVQTRGYANEISYLKASGHADTTNGRIHFVLIQPLSGWSIFQEFLLTRGEGIHHIALPAMQEKDYVALQPWLKAQGVDIAQYVCLDQTTSLYYLDTRKSLGGFYIQIATHNSAIPEQPDEVWDLTDSIPPDGPLMPITEFRHFGVVVRDLMSTVIGWSKLFGVTNLEFRNWRSESGSLEEPTYLGNPVNHAYLTTMVTIGECLTFELIQPTFGPSHYKEDYLNHIGEGVHHLFTAALANENEALQLLQRLDSLDVPNVMGGGLGKQYAYFYYLDTRRVLPGYVTEVFYLGKNSIQGQRPKFEVAMTARLADGPTSNMAVQK